MKISKISQRYVDEFNEASISLAFAMDRETTTADSWKEQKYFDDCRGRLVRRLANLEKQASKANNS